jgi:micrococcal nuclease
MTDWSTDWSFPLLAWRVYDADTIMDMDVDLGFGIQLTITGRLLGINAPELRGVERPDGLRSRDWLKHKMEAAKSISIETTPSTERQTGKYGRWLIRVWADGVNLNDLMVTEGFARRVKY